MQSKENFTTPASVIPRDRWGRPLITPTDGGPRTPYTRATTFAGVLEDTFGLTKWQLRNTITGLTERPDLLLKAQASRGDKTTLDSVAEQAQEAAKASAAANVGTALHQLCERVDLGQDMGVVPSEYRADIDAYTSATRVAGLQMVEVETFGVIDDLKVAGTWDRLVELDGRRYIADIKTGSLDYGMGKIAMQLAVYSRCTPYTPDHGRISRGTEVSQNAGVIIHLPAGTGTCTLHWVDLQAGWEGVQLAAQVRRWRTRKGLSSPFTGPQAADDDDHISDQIAHAGTMSELTLVWEECETHWTDAHTALAEARRALITGTVTPRPDRVG